MKIVVNLLLSNLTKRILEIKHNLNSQSEKDILLIQNRELFGFLEYNLCIITSFLFSAINLSCFVSKVLRFQIQKGQHGKTICSARYNINFTNIYM